MARRKIEVALQQEVDTNEQWADVLKKEGLIVVEAYQAWCGPCKAFENIFKKIKMEQNDDHLKFSIAKADTIDALEHYRGSCKPCFLFYAGGELVAVVRGANAPEIIRTIQEQLAQENKVLKGEAQRKPIVDTVIEDIKKKKAEAKASKQVKNIMKTDKPITICIIKPDMIAKGKKDEIIEKIKSRGYEILEQRDFSFTPEMAKDFYKHREHEPEFKELIDYMTSGPSCVLALSKEGNLEDVIHEWRDDIGASDAAAENPESFRSQYATNKIVNALHGSDTREAALRELGFFFPHGDESENANAQKTLALIRPSALAKHKDQILAKIKEHGFKIAMTKTIKLERAQAEEFYSEHKDKPFFNDLVTEMTSGPIMVLCLVKEDAVNAWRKLIGPKEREKIKDAVGSLRNEFDVTNSPVNALHGPSTPEQAQKELETFFPMEQTVAFIKPGLPAEKKKEIEKKIVDLGFIIASKKSEKLTEDIAKKIYKDSSSKQHFNDLVKLMTSGETDILVLSRENAIQGWKEVIGPVDPEKAKLENPNSLRAIYGVDVLQNALHGASNKQQAEHEIKLLFGDLKFDKHDSNLID